jgi:hypothetical protein
MGDFNDKLRQEGNDTITGSWNFGGEAKLKTIGISALKVPALELNIPVGAEYLQARSETDHSGTLVRWALPVLGAYAAPNVSFKKSFYVKPSVGYYFLPSNGTLVVSDRVGSLGVSGHTVGWSIVGGYNFCGGSDRTGTTSQPGQPGSPPKATPDAAKQLFPVAKGKECVVKPFVELGYRSLVFDSVKLQPQNGFVIGPGGTLVQATSLPQSQITVALSSDWASVSKLQGYFWFPVDR